MAIVTATTVAAWSGDTYSGADSTSLTTIASAVDAAIKRLVWPFQPEATTVTDQILDAPIGNELILPLVPVRSITSVYLHWGAGGDSTEFTSDDLLTQYDDYYLPITDAMNAWSRSGVLLRRGASSWGYELRRTLGRLSTEVDPNRGAVKISYAAGPSSGVADDIEAAAILATLQLYQRRKSALLYVSESWNGRSQSLAPSVFDALHSPEVAGLLAPYLHVRIA